MRVNFAVGFLALLQACHSTPVTPSTFTIDKSSGKNFLAPKDFSPPQTLQLTHEGENFGGRFSPDGQKVIFVSRHRPKHQNSQIYNLNLQNQKEKRVTFNDGEDFSPDYNKKGTRIIYASTTDEMKEHPAPLASPPPAPAEAPAVVGKLHNSEIYESDPDGSHIDRLTDSTGFDGECRYAPDGRRILFTSGREGDLELFEMATEGKNPRRLTTSPGYDGQGEFSPDGKNVVWASSRGDEKVMHLYVMDRLLGKPKAVTTKPAIHWHPTWTSDGKKILFASNRDDENNFEIYVINSDGTCLKRLTYSKGADLYPDLSPNGKQILFTSDRSGTNQLYLMDYVEPKDCAPETP